MTTSQAYDASITTENRDRFIVSSGPDYIRLAVTKKDTLSEVVFQLSEAEAFELDRCLMAARGIVCANRLNLPEPF